MIQYRNPGVLRRKASEENLFELIVTNMFDLIVNDLSMYLLSNILYSTQLKT